MVVIFLVVLFSSIVIFSLQEIQENMALSRSAYDLAQNLREMQDLALSGRGVKDELGNEINNVAGYGLYFNISLSNDYYLSYADSKFACRTNCTESDGGDKKYLPTCDSFGCALDSVIESQINIDPEDRGVVIQTMSSSGYNLPLVSVNFSPPNPTTKIIYATTEYASLDITLTLTSNATKTKKVSVNRAGLIEVH